MMLAEREKKDILKIRGCMTKLRHNELQIELVLATSVNFVGKTIRTVAEFQTCNASLTVSFQGFAAEHRTADIT